MPAKTWLVWLVPPRRNKYADMEPGIHLGPYDLETARRVLSERTQRDGLTGCILDGGRRAAPQLRHRPNSLERDPHASLLHRSGAARAGAQRLCARR